MRTCDFCQSCPRHCFGDPDCRMRLHREVYLTCSGAVFCIQGGDPSRKPRTSNENLLPAMSDPKIEAAAWWCLVCVRKANAEVERFPPPAQLSALSTGPGCMVRLVC